MANALESASLVMIPSGYEDGTLGSLKPTDGSGDFTFTRGSNISATRVNADGNIEKGYENLLYPSNDFSQWTDNINNASVTSGQSGYDGTNDAWLLSATNNFSRIGLNISASGVQSFSVYAKASTYNFMRLRADGSTTGQCFFDLENGTLGTETNTIESKIESIGNGWYRCSIILSSTTTNFKISAAQADNDLNGTDGSIYIQDAMLNQGLVAYPYVETTTAPVAGGILEDMPRLDYSNGSCPSLLLEPSRTNLIGQSEYLSTGYQIVTGLTFVQNTDETLSPEGKYNATKLTATSGTWYSWKNIAATNNTCTISMYVKAVDAESNNTFRFRLGNTYSDTFTATGEWQRFFYTALNDSLYSGLTFPSPTELSSLYIYGLQLEQDATYPTSYIPTYGVSQTRLEDNLSNLVGLDALNNEATIMAEFKVDSTGSRYMFQSTGGGSYVNINQYTEERLRIIVRFEGVNQFNVVQSNKVYPNTWYKIALRYSTNKADVFLNGENIISGTGTWTLEPLDNLTWSFVEGNETKQLLLFPTALSDEACIELTTI